MRLAALAILSSPAFAFAGPDVRVDVDVDVKVRTSEPVVIVEPVVVAPPHEPAHRGRANGNVLRGSRTELGFFLEGGRFAAGDVVSGQFGVRGELAQQLGPLRVGIEGSLAKFSGERTPNEEEWWDTEDASGEIARIGLAARLRSTHDLPADPTMPNGAAASLYVEGGIGKQYIAWTTGGSDERYDFVLGLGFEIAGGKRRLGGFDLNVRAVVAPSLDDSVETHDVSVIAGLGGRFGI